MRFGSTILASCSALLAFSGADPALANVGYFAGSGQDIFLASTADVQMVGEDVTIVIRPEAAQYTCIFELRNLSAEAVELQAGFPLSGDWYDGWYHRKADGKPQSCDTPEADIVADRFRFGARDDDTTYHVRYVRHDTEEKFQHVFLWSMHFAPHETRRLHVTYDMSSSDSVWPASRRDWEILTGQTEGKLGEGFSGMEDTEGMSLEWLLAGGLHWYSYVTETGASWAGEIEHADFHVRTDLADETLRERFDKQTKALASHRIKGESGPPDLGPRLVHLCLAPAGSVAPLDERDRELAKHFGVAWEPRTVPNAYDWHFAPFQPGPKICVGWFTTFLPATEAGLRVFLDAADSPLDRTSPHLELVRAALAAWHGVAPKEDAIRSRLEKLVWYAPVSGRIEAELPDEVKAQLALLDARLAASSPK